MLDRVTQRSRGFGFVHFDNKEDMDEAIEKLHDTEIDGRKISVTRAIPQDSIQPGTPAAALGKRERYANFASKLLYQTQAHVLWTFRQGRADCHENQVLEMLEQSLVGSFGTAESPPAGEI